MYRNYIKYGSFCMFKYFRFTKMSNKENLDKPPKNFPVGDNSDINILLLGETGVGKSTFINSVANYLFYTLFEKAQKEKLLVLIPSEFTVDVEGGKRHKIVIGLKDKKEYQSVGDTTTQDVRTYVFPTGNKESKIRFIDTPGMGDKTGIGKDDINCENILDYISHLHELHAICFLFKPTTKADVCFEYYVNQIFSRLDKSASKNIIFIFTNTKSINYCAGDTLNILEKAVEKICLKNNIEIPVKKNIFCFDNEAFSYLTASKNGVENMVLKENEARLSWNKSVIQSWR